MDKALEAGDVRLPVVAMDFRFKSPVGYDDLVEIETQVKRRSRASLTFAYRLTHEADGRLVAEAETTLACVDRDGKVRRLPEGI